ncbi:hypothetical protein [Clavibacter tessellarius]|uniref:hypothetical protein n=1 Tax=Clavibacter tessellarius TaxID=31965 RepID=UPI0032437707
MATERAEPTRAVPVMTGSGAVVKAATFAVAAAGAADAATGAAVASAAVAPVARPACDETTRARARRPTRPRRRAAAMVLLGSAAAPVAAVGHAYPVAPALSRTPFGIGGLGGAIGADPDIRRPAKARVGQRPPERRPAPPGEHESPRAPT